MMASVLIATDGSEGSAMAVALAVSIPWPKGTSLGVVAVVLPVAELVGLPYVPVVPSNSAEIERTELRRAQEVTWRAVDALRAAGHAAHCRVMRGRAADMIVSLAKRYNADLIVLGSRGLATFKAAIVGSVSAEVVDRAPCPVLIARTDHVGPTIVADDGSPQAEAARSYLVARPHLIGRSARLVGVVPVATLWPDALVPLDARTMGLLAESHTAARSALAKLLQGDAADLAAAGVDVTTEVREGDAAQELSAAAQALGAGLIVAGSHRRRGLRRFALGSVTRSVLHASHASVLIVPMPKDVGRPARAPADAA
jgi:nucleotide-binding universal stress UspA family protein